jgi:dihydroxyacetone kinase-like predicted kinase
MAAEQAGPMAKDRDVRVLPTKTIPQGISAMLSFDETASADENQMNMISAFENVETAQVTFAARDSEVDGKPIKKAKLWAFAMEKSNS